MRYLIRLFSCLSGLLVSLSATAQTAKDFSDGIGYYVQTDGAFKILNEQTNLSTAAFNSLTLKEVLDIDQPFAMDVSRDFRLFTYGIELGSGIIPPNIMITLCMFTPDRNDNTVQSVVHGPVPAHIQPILIPGGIFSGGELPIYEIIPAPGLRDAKAAEITAAGPKMFFSLNLENSCDKGWIFKFKPPQQPTAK